MPTVSKPPVKNVFCLGLDDSLKAKFMAPFKNVPLTTVGVIISIYEKPDINLRISSTAKQGIFSSLPPAFTKGDLLLAIVDIGSTKSVEESVKWLQKVLNSDALAKLCVVPTLSSECVSAESHLKILHSTFKNVSSVADVSSLESIEKALLNAAQLKLGYAPVMSDSSKAPSAPPMSPRIARVMAGAGVDEDPKPLFGPSV